MKKYEKPVLIIETINPADNIYCDSLSNDDTAVDPFNMPTDGERNISW